MTSVSMWINELYQQNTMTTAKWNEMPRSDGLYTVPNSDWTHLSTTTISICAGTVPSTAA